VVGKRDGSTCREVEAVTPPLLRWASGTGPQAAKRPLPRRGAFGTRGPVPLHSSLRSPSAGEAGLDAAAFLLAKPHVLEEVGGAGGFVGPAVGLSGEFGVDAAGVASVAEGLKERGKFEQACSQGEVLVNAGPHVVEVDVDQLTRVVAESASQGPLAHALHVAEVDGEFQRLGMAHPLLQFIEAGHCVDEHAGLGLEAQEHAAAGGMVEHGLQARGQPVPEVAFNSGVSDRAAPEGDAGAAKFRCQVDGPLQEVDPASAVLRTR
jgi:hypothetical protein